MNDYSQNIKVHNFSSAFEQMCSIIAIGEVGKVEEILEGLILQTTVLLPDTFSSARNFVDSINGLFGLSIPEHEIQFVIDKLVRQNTLVRTSDERYFIGEDLRKTLQNRVDEAYELEISIRDSWEEEVKEKYPLLEFTALWMALRHYLAKAFQRHGIQTVALLNTSVEIPDEYSESLSTILNKIISSEFSTDLQHFAKSAVSDFMANTGSHPKRAKYISQLADGAFSYYSLMIPEETSQQFKKNLSPLLLFLDTNFLYGILDLTVSPQVAVSNELIGAITKHQLPFKLHRHPKTVRELQGSIDHYASYLSTLTWSRSISRAASKSRLISGVEQKYHQVYAETNLDVESFFKQYRHIDVLLDQKNIETFPPSGNHLEEISDLTAQYDDFLRGWGKEKSYTRRDHDMTILFEARRLRSNSKSSLEAGALLLTCDYSLYRFDWETSKRNGTKAVTVLPNIFWQVLRPFVLSDSDFDYSFAETFAIPEFRIIGSKATQACSKMVNILAGLKNLPEETAARMLANDALLVNLQKIDNDQEFKEYVELAIVQENAALVEEKTIIATRLEQEKLEKFQKIKELEAEREVRVAEELTAKEREKAIKKEAKTTILQEKQARIDAETKVRDKEIEIRLEREKSAKEQEKFQKIFAGLVSVIFIGIFELMAYFLPITWIKEHPYSTLLQLAMDTVIALTVIAIFVPKWRKRLLAIDVITLIIGTFLTVYFAKP